MVLSKGDSSKIANPLVTEGGWKAEGPLGESDDVDVGQIKVVCVASGAGGGVDFASWLADIYDRRLAR
jgi:hypothetical protein